MEDRGPPEIRSGPPEDSLPPGEADGAAPRGHPVLVLLVLGALAAQVALVLHGSAGEAPGRIAGRALGGWFGVLALASIGRWIARRVPRGSEDGARITFCILVGVFTLLQVSSHFRRPHGSPYGSRGRASAREPDREGADARVGDTWDKLRRLLATADLLGSSDWSEALRATQSRADRERLRSVSTCCRVLAEARRDLRARAAACRERWDRFEEMGGVDWSCATMPEHLDTRIRALETLERMTRDLDLAEGRVPAVLYEGLVKARVPVRDRQEICGALRYRESGLLAELRWTEIRFYQVALEQARLLRGSFGRWGADEEGGLVFRDHQVREVFRRMAAESAEILASRTVARRAHEEHLEEVRNR